MSRSGYCDDYDSEWQLIMYRGAVAQAIRGKRGQQFLRDLMTALDAIPTKRLIRDELETANGEVCALGSLGKLRGIPMEELDPYDRETIAEKFGIAASLAAEVMFENDDDFGFRIETPEMRWTRMRRWAIENLKAKP